jgi:hypothetical protein
MLTTFSRSAYFLLLCASPALGGGALAIGRPYGLHRAFGRGTLGGIGLVALRL